MYYLFHCTEWEHGTATIDKNLEARAWDVMCRRTWTNRITNIRVLETNKKTKIFKTIKRRQLKYVGHIMRQTEKYELSRLKNCAVGNLRPSKSELPYQLP